MRSKFSFHTGPKRLQEFSPITSSVKRRGGGGGTKKSFPKTREGREKKGEKNVCWDSSFWGNKRRGYPYIPQYLPSANAYY